jgi:hypothetical protein
MEGQLIDHARMGSMGWLQEHCGRLGFDGHGNMQVEYKPQ